MRNQITTILAVCGALLASATTASAFMGGKEAGSICIFGQDVHCWIDPATYSWQKDHPAFAENEDTGTLEAETDVAMWTPTYELKAWYCMKGSMGKQMQHKDSTCIGGTPRPVYGRRGDAGEYTGANDTVIAMSKFPKTYLYTVCIPHGQTSGGTRMSDASGNCNGYKARTYQSYDIGTSTDDTVVAMMTQDMVDSWRSTLERHYDYSAVDLDENYATQLAFRGRGSTCSSNPYGRRSFYCNDSEVEAPVEQITASTEFGNCLLDDKPIVLEELVDCRSDACLGRKFYYGSFGKVGR